VRYAAAVSDVRDSKNRAWREVAAIDAAYARGEIDDEHWHRAMADLIVPAYLAGDVRRGSGFDIACAVERPHRSDARLYYRAVGIRGAIA
jgi:hypothetical protein